MSPVAEEIPKGEWRSGWTLVLASALGFASGTIHFHSLGVMIVPLEEAMGWSRSEISGGLLTLSIAAGVLTFFAGAAADRIGARRVAVTGMILYALGLAAIGYSGPSLISWYVVWSILAVFQAMVSGVIFAIAVVSRFSTHRGLALGVMLSGSGLTIAVVPPIALWLTETWGWQAAYFGLAAIILLLPLPLLLAFFRDAHDVARLRPSQKTATIAADARVSKSGLSISAALTGRHVWRLAISFFMITLGVATFLVHLQPMLIESGITAKKAAFIASVIGPTLIVGRVVTGVLLDRLSTPLVAGTIALLPAICCLLMLGFDGSVAIALLIAMLLGVATGAEGDVLSYATAEYVGEKNYGAIYSLIGALIGFGFGFAPYLAGLTYDLFGSYSPLLKFNVVAALIAALILYTIGKAPEYD
ncbi:MAG: MFS transporter [Gammaproteobacteria bacterium]|nr:MFS transporter [Gammaproteobacteria bacterium]